MTVTVKVDAQGRVVIPQAERERLGLPHGGMLELVSTPEGILLEPRRRSTMRVEEDGLPVIAVEDLDLVPNAEVLDAIHQQRAGR